MIGDHHQLPPVIKNMAFQKFSNMEQSLFTRLVRLGVPTVDLDAQGRARARFVLAYVHSWKNEQIIFIYDLGMQASILTITLKPVFLDEREVNPIFYFYILHSDLPYI